MITCPTCGAESPDAVCAPCGRAKATRWVVPGVRRSFVVSLVLMAVGLIGVLWFLTSALDRPHTRGQLSACQSNEKNIGTALEMYATDNKGEYPLSLAPLAPKYLKVIPTCPAAGTDTYSSSYQRNSPQSYRFYCSGSNHTDLLNGSANFPQYTSEQGLIGGL